MVGRKSVTIPKGIVCPDCKSHNLIGSGKRWKKNTNGDSPPRVKVQQYLCNDCGKVFIDGEGAKSDV